MALPASSVSGVEIVVPWRGACPYRERALEWVLAQLGTATVATAPDGEWSKAAAVTPAVEASRADLIVIHDADVFCDGLEKAIGAVEAGEPWAMPHERVHRLNVEATDALIASSLGSVRDRFAERPYRGIWGGGILVLPRETYLSVPLDPRFVGWGGEDISHANALWHLAGEGWRGQADLIHLWHPPQNRMNRQHGSPESHALAARYRQARFKPNQMRALIDEFRRADDTCDAPEQAVSAGAQV